MFERTDGDLIVAKLFETTVCLWRHSAVICAKTAEPIVVPFGLCASTGRKYHMLHEKSR